MTEVITARIEADLVRRLDACARLENRTRSEILRSAMEDYLGRPERAGGEWKPRTALGRELWRLRRRYVEAGGELLSQEAIRAEVGRRRGERR